MKAQSNQTLILVVAVAIVAGVAGVVITNAFAKREVTVKLDLGPGNVVKMGELSGDVEEVRKSANEEAAIATLRAIASA